MSWLGARTTLGECPRWDERCQLTHWVDIDGGSLHRARLVGGSWQATHTDVVAPLAGAVLAGDAEAEHWILAIGGELVEWSADGGRGASRAVEPPARTDRVRLNELVTDPCGRIWVGSMAYDWEPGAGSFFRVDADGNVHREVADVTIANGIGWSPDGATMYSTDTAAGAITAWRYDLRTGAISRPRLFAAPIPVTAGLTDLRWTWTGTCGVPSQAGQGSRVSTALDGKSSGSGFPRRRPPAAASPGLTEIACW